MNATDAIVERTIASPVGPLRLRATATALCGVYFRDHPGAPPPAGPAPARHEVLDAVVEQLARYFDSARHPLAAPLAAAGTEFQRRVWDTLMTIEPGTTWSYAQLAAAIGRPRAVRAVATANARNPLSLFVPCHRVIGSDGALRGYAGGLLAKRFLLAHEREAFTTRSARPKSLPPEDPKAPAARSGRRPARP